MVAHGIKFAGFLADSIFSSDGVLPGPKGFLKKAVDVMHKNGGIFIADEVQPGFARTGEAFRGSARHGEVPNTVTTGKPMGNSIPVSALLAKSNVLAAFSGDIPYFNTFGGNPAVQAVLTVIKEEGLQEHSRVVGEKLLAELLTLKEKYDCVGDMHGAGLFIGFELVTDKSSKTPDKQLALDITEKLCDNHVLTSVAGSYGNVLKLRPPLAFQESDIDRLVGALDKSLVASGK